MSNKTNNHIVDANKMVELKQAIIEKIHGLPWEEARWVEFTGFKLEDLKWETDNDNFIDGVGWWDEDKNVVVDVYGDPIKPYVTEPITLSRVLQALDCDEIWDDMFMDRYGFNFSYGDDYMQVEWKLLKDDGSTATLEDQSEETIEALTKIFLTNQDGN